MALLLALVAPVVTIVRAGETPAKNGSPPTNEVVARLIATSLDGQRGPGRAGGPD